MYDPDNKKNKNGGSSGGGGGSNKMMMNMVSKNMKEAITEGVIKALMENLAKGVELGALLL